jgi:two-component system, cell cycle response regulator
MPMNSDPAASPEANQSTEKPVILIVDDSRLMRHAIKKILAEDFTLLEGVDGEDGWEKLLADPGIQVVFTDLSMPGLDGFGLLQRIRGSDDARVREVPVIVITGNEDDETIKERALQSGATDFITKPFQSVQIRARADAHAKSQRKLQEVTSALEEQATLDPVTQLVNAKHFTQRGNECMSFAVRHKSELAIILLDLDGYATLTMDMEESMRDQLLVQIADVLRAQTRREDTVARLEDGRFALLLPASNPVGTRHLGKRILSEIENMKFFHGGRRVKVSASMGIATPDIKPEMNFEVILKSAMQRLDVALQGGGNCLVKDDKTTVVELQEAVHRMREEEIARQLAEQEARDHAEAEAKAKAAEQARLRAEAEAQVKAEEAARLKAEEEAREKAAEEDRLRAEEEARIKAEEAARLKAEEEARIKAEEQARLRAEEEARIVAEQAAMAKAAEEARLRAEEEARVKAEQEAKARAEEESRLRAEEEARSKAEEAARITAEREALQRAEMEAIAQAAEEMRVRAQQLEAEQAQRKAEDEARLSDAAPTVAIVVAAEAQPASAPEDQLDRYAVADARSRAEQETALIRAEAESRRRVAENEQKERVAEEARRRSSMEAELARVESELKGGSPDDSASGEQLSSEVAPRSLPPLLAAVVRGVLPLLDALNRRFKLKWDGKLDTLRKRL